MKTMKAITLWQPWSQLVADGRKKIETRSWPTNHRGLLAIHASKGNMDSRLATQFGYSPYKLKLGALLCVVEIVDCEEMPEHSFKRWLANFVGKIEEGYGHYEPGRYAWHLRHRLTFDQAIVCSGRQGLWTASLPASVDSTTDSLLSPASNLSSR